MADAAALPSEDVVDLDWSPRPYQKPVWDYFLTGGRRGMCCWHRRAGKDYFALHLFRYFIYADPGVYWHMLPTLNQGKKVVWDGRDNEGNPLLDIFPPSIVKRRREDEMKVEFHGTSSIFQVVGSDYYNTLVGANPKGVVLSEWALTDFDAWTYIAPMLAANKGWALFIFTPRGRTKQWEFFERAQQMPNWFTEVLTVDDTHVIEEEALEEERVFHDEAYIRQEYYCDPDAPIKGAYYADQLMLLEKMKPRRIGSVPHDPALKVETWWDIGIGDSTAIWFAQRYGAEIRLIDYYESSGEPLSHYVSVLRQKERTPEKKDGYIYSHHVFPQDIRAREFITGRTREDMLRQYGLYPRVVAMHKVEDGIETVRATIPRCWFDWKRCERGLAALRMYRKEWNDKKRQWNAHPVHDWTSHAADAFRYGAMFNPPRAQKPLPTVIRRAIV